MKTEHSKMTVVVGMSGGVDSSVAALVLKQQGYNVIGLHMKSENSDTCEIDLQNAKAVCDIIGIELVVHNYTTQMQFVKDYFINEYKVGRTPNPCVVCNRYVKFKPFVDYALSIGANYFATGHYAKIERKDGKAYLYKALDTNKDQSYFLNQLTKEQLNNALFPLGDYTKEQVREIALKNGFVNANKKDSFDVCFIGSKKFKEYMSEVCLEKSGDIVDASSNKKVGEHTGLSKYTIGQRKGLGIGGQKSGSGDSWFVLSKDIQNNILYVVQGDGKELLNKSLVSSTVNWLVDKPKDRVLRCSAKCRYRQDDQPATIHILEDDKVRVVFDTPQRAITTGQYVVFYDKNMCLGGGAIDKVFN